MKLRIFMGGLLLTSLCWSHAHPRDLEGRFVQSPLKPWFDTLKSKRGFCCSDADGNALADTDWESDNGRFRVRIPRYHDYQANTYSEEMIWMDVPPDAVITEPNRAGRTMVWPIYADGVTIRCFIPGSMS